MTNIQFEIQNKDVQEFFKKVIKGYLVCDIKNLLKDEYDDKEFGGCAAPLAMTVFSAMNLLGYLTSTKHMTQLHIDNSADKVTDTDICIKEYCKDWMKKVHKKYGKSTIQEMFVDLFRNGFAHQFISIYPSAITRSSTMKVLIGFSGNSDDLPILQVKILAQDFLKSIDQLELKINPSSSINIKFIENFHIRMNEQKEKYLKKNSKLFDKIRRNKNDIGITVTHETTRFPDVIKPK